MITRYPMAPHVEDARDRLVAMNRPVPEPTQSGGCRERRRGTQPTAVCASPTRRLDIIKRGPTVVEAVHVGEPTLDDPKRTLAPDVTKENMALFNEAVNAGKPANRRPRLRRPAPNEPPRSDQPSAAPSMAAPAGGTGVGVSIVNAPSARCMRPRGLIPMRW